MNKKFGLWSKSRLWTLVFLVLISLALAEPLSNDQYASLDLTQQANWLLDRNNWINDPNFLARTTDFFSNSAYTFNVEHLALMEQFIRSEKVDFRNNQHQKVANLFFSSEKFSADQSRKNIQNNRQKAEDFFQAKWGNKEFSFDVIGRDFSYDGTTLKHGQQSFSLAEYENQDQVKGFIVREKGICVRTTINTCFTGTDQGDVKYDAKQKSFVFAGEDTSGHKFEHNFASSEDTNIQIEGNQVRVEGKATGRLKDGTEFINREGVLVISPKIISAENAEVYNRKFYADGRFEYDPQNQKAKIYDHGAPISSHGTRTVFVEQETGVGVISQGQKKPSEVVTIEIKTLVSSATPPQTRTEARKIAQALEPLSGDLKQDAHVTITKNIDNTVTIDAKGKVAVGFYKNNQPQPQKPFFQGKTGKTEYQFTNHNQKPEAVIKGEGTYLDENYGSFRSNEQNEPLFQGGIQSKQEGSVVQILSREKNDVIFADCFSCVEEKEAFSIQKNIAVGTKSFTMDGLIEGTTESKSLTFNYIATKEGLSFSPFRNQLGQLANSLGEDQVAILGKSFVIDAKHGKSRQQLRFHSNDEVQIYLEQDGRILSRIPFGSKKILGNPVVVTDSKTVNKISRILQAVDNRDYARLAQLEKITEPRIRDLIKREKGIDVALIDDQNYLRNLREGGHSLNEFFKFSNQIEERYGIDLTNCDARCNQILGQSLVRGENLAYLSTAAQLNRLKAKLNFALAEKQSLASDGQGNSINREIEKIQKQIDQVLESRKILETATAQRINLETLRTQIREDPSPKESLDDRTIAGYTKSDLRQIDERIASNEVQIVSLKRDLENLPHQISNLLPSERAGGQGERILAVQTENLNRRIERLQREQNELFKTKEEQIQQFSTYILGKHIDTRPDIAAGLAVDAGLNSIAEEIADGKLKAVDPDLANVIKYRSLLAQGKIDQAAALRPQISGRKDIFERVEQIQYDYALEAVQELVDRRTQLVNDKQAELHDRKGLLSFLEFFGIRSGGQVTEFFTAIAKKGIITDDETNVFDRLGAIDFSNPEYQKYREDLDFQSLDALEQKRVQAILMLKALNEGKEKGLDVNEVLQKLSQPITKKEIRAKRFGEGTVTVSETVVEASPLIESLHHEISGLKNSPELQAKLEFEEIQEQLDFNGGKVSAVKEELVSFAEKFGDTTSGQRANLELEGLGNEIGGISVETLEKWGDLAIEVSSIDNFIPFATIAKTGRAVGKVLFTGGKVLGRTAVQNIDTIARIAEATSSASIAAKAGARSLLEGTAKAIENNRVASGIVTATKVTGKTVFGAAKFAGKAVVAPVKFVAERTDDVGFALSRNVKLAQSEAELATAVKALENYKLAKATNKGILSKEFGLSTLRKGYRAAENNARIAADDYLRAVKNGDPNLPEKLARFHQSLEEVKKNSLSVSQLISDEVRKISPRSASVLDEAWGIIDNSPLNLEDAAKSIVNKEELVVPVGTPLDEATETAVEEARKVIDEAGIQPSQIEERVSALEREVLEHANSDAAAANNVKDSLTGSDTIIPKVTSELAESSGKALPPEIGLPHEPAALTSAESLDSLVDEAVSGIKPETKPRLEPAKALEEKSSAVIHRQTIPKGPLPVTSLKLKQYASPGQKIISKSMDNFYPESRKIFEEQGLVIDGQIHYLEPAEGSSKTLGENIRSALKGTAAGDLGIFQATAFLRKDGKVVYVKLAHNDYYEKILTKKGILNFIRDTPRRDLAVKNIVGEVLEVSKTKNVKVGEFEYQVSEYLDNYQSLGKFNKKANLENFIKEKGLSAEAAAKLREQAYFDDVLSIFLRRSDSELGVVKTADGYSLVLIDEELGFSGMHFGDNRYITVSMITGELSSGDVIRGIGRWEDFLNAAGKFDEVKFKSVYGTQIEKVNNLRNSPEGLARIRQHLVKGGYSSNEADELIAKLKAVDLEKDLRRFIENNGQLNIVPDSGLLQAELDLNQNMRQFKAQIDFLPQDDKQKFLIEKGIIEETPLPEAAVSEQISSATAKSRASVTREVADLINTADPDQIRKILRERGLSEGIALQVSVDPRGVLRGLYEQGIDPNEIAKRLDELKRGVAEAETLVNKNLADVDVELGLEKTIAAEGKTSLDLESVVHGEFKTVPQTLKEAESRMIELEKLVSKVKGLPQDDLQRIAVYSEYARTDAQMVLLKHNLPPEKLDVLAKAVSEGGSLEEIVQKQELLTAEFTSIAKGLGDAEIAKLTGGVLGTIAPSKSSALILDSGPLLRELVSQKGEFLDFVEQVDQIFPEEVQKVFLGSDGLEYTKFAYDSGKVNPNSRFHFMNRKKLATSEEYAIIIEKAKNPEKYLPEYRKVDSNYVPEKSNFRENVELMTNIKAGNIQLYQDMDTAIKTASEMVGRDPSLSFENLLFQQFDVLMQNLHNRRKVMELVADLSNDVDLTKPAVLVDYNGRAHVQPFILKTGLNWLKGNWKRLKPDELALLGKTKETFVKAKVDLFLGVSDSYHLENILYFNEINLNLKGVVGDLSKPRIFAEKVGPGRNFVAEDYRTFLLDDEAFARGEIRYLPSDADEQAHIIQQKMIIVSEKAKKESLEKIVTAEEKSLAAKIWPFKMNKHRNLAVEGVEFSRTAVTIPGIPAKYATITEGSVKLNLFAKKVWNPDNFAGQLKFGDDYLQLHVEVDKAAVSTVTTAKDLLKAVEKMKQLDLGMAVVGDSPNPSLVKLAEKIGAVKTKPPLRQRILAGIDYWIGSKLGYFPKTDAPVERIILTPDKLISSKTGVKVEEVTDELQVGLVSGLENEPLRVIGQGSPTPSRTLGTGAGVSCEIKRVVVGRAIACPDVSVLNRRINAFSEVKFAEEGVGFFKAEFPELVDLFKADAGVSEGYTIEEHIQRVFDIFNSQTESVLPTVKTDLDLEKVMNAVIPLHDLGKPAAIAAGSKRAQHEFTVPILIDKLKQTGFSEKEIRLAINLVDHDLIGETARGLKSPQNAYRELQLRAIDADMEVDEFYKLQKLFFTSDAASYPRVRASAFQEIDGKLILNSDQVRELERLIASSSREMEEAADVVPITQITLDEILTITNLNPLNPFDYGKYSKISDFLEKNPNLVSQVPDEFRDTLTANRIDLINTLDNIKNNLVAPDDVSLLSMQSSGVTLLEDLEGNLMVRYGRKQVPLATAPKRVFRDNPAILIDSSNGVETVLVYNKQNKNLRIGYITRDEASSVITPQAVSEMERRIDGILSEGASYLDVQIEEGRLLSLRAENPRAFEQAMKNKYHHLPPEKSQIHLQELSQVNLETLVMETKQDPEDLERAVATLSKQIQSEYLSGMEHTHTTAFQNLERILSSSELRGPSIPSPRDAFKGAVGQVFTFRNDPGTLGYGDVTFIIPKERFGSESIFLPGDLTNGVQMSSSAAEKSISFGKKIERSLNSQDADKLLSEYIATDMIKRRLTAEQPLEKIVESLSREDLFRYQLQGFSGSVARVNDFTALGRFEGHSPAIGIDGTTMLVEKERIPEVRDLLEKTGKLGKVKVIGVEGKWGKFDPLENRVRGGNNEIRANAYAYLAGFQEGEIVDLGDNIFTLKPDDLPNLVLQKPKSLKVRLFELLGIEDKQKGIVGKRISELEREGKTSEEIEQVIGEEFEEILE